MAPHRQNGNGRISPPRPSSRMATVSRTLSRASWPAFALNVSVPPVGRLPGICPISRPIVLAWPVTSGSPPGPLSSTLRSRARPHPAHPAPQPARAGGSGGAALRTGSRTGATLPGRPCTGAPRSRAQHGAPRAGAWRGPRRPDDGAVRPGDGAVRPGTAWRLPGWGARLVRGCRLAFRGRFIRGPVRAAAAASPSSLLAARLLTQPWSIRVRSSVTRSSGLPSRSSTAMTCSGACGPGWADLRSTCATRASDERHPGPLGEMAGGCGTRVMYS